jgi:hypothetical protein
VRDDLLDAQACLDWAVVQFPDLEARINSWLNAKVKVQIEDAGPEVPNNVIVAVLGEEIPRSFNVEIGAYLNTIRSSLDILASAFASRYGIFLAKDCRVTKFFLWGLHCAANPGDDPPVKRTAVSHPT